MVLVTVNAVVYNGKTYDHMAKVHEVVAGLPTLKKVVVVEFAGAMADGAFSGDNDGKW